MTTGSASTGLIRHPSLEESESITPLDGGSEKATARTVPSNWSADGPDAHGHVLGHGGRASGLGSDRGQIDGLELGEMGQCSDHDARNASSG